MSAEIPNAFPDPNELRVALIVPSERSFYSPGVGAPQTFRGKPYFIERDGELHRQPKNAEELSEMILRNPEYALKPTAAVRRLASIEGVHSYVRRPSSGTKDFLRKPYTVWKYNIDEVEETAATIPDFIEPIDLLILTEAFKTQVRRRTIVDLSA